MDISGLEQEGCGVDTSGLEEEGYGVDTSGLVQEGIWSGYIWFRTGGAMEWIHLV